MDAIVRRNSNNIKKIRTMSTAELVLANFFMGFMMSMFVIIGWRLADIRDELKKLNENNKNRQNL